MMFLQIVEHFIYDIFFPLRVKGIIAGVEEVFHAICLVLCRQDVISAASQSLRGILYAKHDKLCLPVFQLHVHSFFHYY